MSVSLIIVLLLIIAYRAGARRGLVQTIVNVLQKKCLRLLMKETVF